MRRVSPACFLRVVIPDFGMDCSERDLKDGGFRALPRKKTTTTAASPETSFCDQTKNIASSAGGGGRNREVQPSSQTDLKTEDTIHQIVM